MRFRIDPTRSYTHQRLLEDIYCLCDGYPDVIRVGGVGFSEQGREIPLLSIGSGERRLLATGAIHGREYVTVGFLMKSLQELIETKSVSSSAQEELLSRCTLDVIPMCNPDSVEMSLGRVPLPQGVRTPCGEYKNNANNTNLNANFPYLWEQVPPERDKGPTPASERETRLLMDICEQNHYEAMLSFHSRGDCIYWRDKGNGEIHGDRELAQRLRDDCGYFLCPPTDSPRDYAGGFENWFRHRFRRPGLCVELVADEEADFTDCVRGFYELCRWENTRHTLLLAMDALEESTPEHPQIIK